jgi:hypothetical protein
MSSLIPDSCFIQEAMHMGSVALTFFGTCGPQYVGQLSFLDTTYCGQFLRF